VLHLRLPKAGPARLQHIEVKATESFKVAAFHATQLEHAASQRVVMRNCVAQGYQVAQRSDYDHKTVEMVEEQAVVTKNKKLTGGLRVQTIVREDEAIIDEPLSTEQVEVARVSLDRWVEAPIPVRQDGDTTVITLHEEVIMVEKRLRAVEEVHLIRSVRSAPQRITLRREEAVVEHLDPVTNVDRA
jgi:stress response protein YsnF